MPKHPQFVSTPCVIECTPQFWGRIRSFDLNPGTDLVDALAGLGAGVDAEQKDFRSAGACGRALFLSRRPAAS